MIENDLLPPGIILNKDKVLNDYRLVCESRQVSLLGRKEVMGGKAKFGIFGDGKELVHVTLASVFQRGDFRSGYYRDQTIENVLGNLSWQQFYAQIYAHANIEHEPHTGGRSMNGHYATRWLDEEGDWVNQTELYNSVCDISPTAGQIPRSIGLAYASMLYRTIPALQDLQKFSKNGNEIVFATIGDASTSQGMFWETMNAAGVLQVPLLMSVWDDGYGISVPVKYQTTKGSISEAMAGLQRTATQKGVEIFQVKGWDYIALMDTYQKAARICREEHVPVLVHVQELTQPQGHSSSGSHERYKSKQRLAWEDEFDCNRQFKNWILENQLATTDELEEIENSAKEVAKEARNRAWKAVRDELNNEATTIITLLEQVAEEAPACASQVLDIVKQLQQTYNPIRKDFSLALRKALRILHKEGGAAHARLSSFLSNYLQENEQRFNTFLYAENKFSPLLVEPVTPQYASDAPLVDGREIIRSYFDSLFARDKRVFAMGEDVGFIGDVNQGMAGLQEKYGELRITDTGIRETTIIGQGIGMAMRGLRPIVEIQYFDYIYYTLATLTDDLACLRYRTANGQQAPLIIRTRGHRLEGIWHSGSPMGAVINSLRGLHIAVPRNFTQAAGIYNTLMQGSDPGLVVEPLNGYRLKEKLPANLADICVPLGHPEVLKEGEDVTIVTYGSMCRIVMEAATMLSAYGIEVEVIDIQTLLPFDVTGTIVASIQKTNRVIFADEDVPGGASAYMMQQILDVQKGYQWLDSAPKAVSAKAHRPPYGSDGDYYTKPNVDDIFEQVYAMMHEYNPAVYPSLY